MQARFIILITLLLLCLAPEQRSDRVKDLPSISGHPLQLAYLFGIKNTISKKFQNIHKSLGIQHFMTPSGLHLSVFTSLLFLFLTHKWSRFIVLICFGVVAFRFDHIDSFQRMTLFAALRHNPWRPISTRISFMATFLLLLIQYLSNPLSYCLSFLFLGIILGPEKKLAKLLLLILGQFFVSFWFNQKFYPIGSFLGAILTATSFLSFPVMLLEFIFQISWFTERWMKLLILFDSLKGPEFLIPFGAIFPFFLFKKRIMKRAALILGLFFFVDHFERPKIPKYLASVPKNHQSISRIKNGVRLEYDNGMHCYSRLKEDQWIGHCYK